MAEIMQNVDTIAEGGYYVRSLEGQKANITKADFIVLSDHSGSFYSAAQTTTQLLNYVRTNAALRQNRAVYASRWEGYLSLRTVGDSTQ